jgi:hypothetical protein
MLYKAQIAVFCTKHSTQSEHHVELAVRKETTRL